MPSENAKLLSIWPPRTHSEQNWPEGCSQNNSSENTNCFPPSVVNSTQNFPPMQGKGERELSPSPVPHRWIKKCALLPLVQTVIIWSIYVIKVTFMKPGYLHYCISYPTLQKRSNVHVYRTAEKKTRKIDENGKGSSSLQLQR